MGTFDDIGQKISGKVDQVKGEFNQQRGQGVKGGMQKITGKVKEKIADMKLHGRARQSTDALVDEDIN